MREKSTALWDRKLVRHCASIKNRKVLRSLAGSIAAERLGCIMISDRPENRHDPLDLTFAAIRKAGSPSVSEPRQPDEILRRIAQRAFQLYEARGREDGHAVEDVAGGGGDQKLR
jgi:hypothetical protein